jgi:hypothetical protein
MSLTKRLYEDTYDERYTQTDEQCPDCGRTKLLSYYRSAGKDGYYKAWLCPNPKCGFEESE